MKIANRLVVFLLIAAMSLVAGGQSGRAGTHDARAIEICAEESIAIIYVDAEGREVPAAPICDCAACKHCAVPALALLPTAPDAAATPHGAHPVATASRSFDLRRAEWSARQARGPPAPKAMT